MKIPRSDKPGPGKYDETEGVKWTRKKVIATIFSKG
jgi:hypothetical protein